MKFLSLLERGSHHQNFNEDFLYNHALTKDILICAVMDGCSSAKDSYFTASLYAKSLHKSSRMLPQMKQIIEDFDVDTMTVSSIADFFMNQLFDDLKRAKKLLFLEIEEVLSTISLLVYDKEKKEAAIAMSGDGLFCVDGEITEIDQNNIPNFLGYHLNKKYKDVRHKEIQSWFFDSVSDISIATDGIDKLLINSKKKPVGYNVRQRFFLDKPANLESNFLKEQYRDFTERGFIPYDDIGIIRIINND